MANHKSLIVKMSLLFSILVGVSSAQNIKGLKLDTKLPVLNNRAFFTFPTGSVNSARQADIMAADPNINRETRIMLEISDMKLVFFAQEMYLFGDDDMYTDAAKEKSQFNFTRKLLNSKREILSTPTVFDSTQEAILINSLQVRTGDNSLFRISAYINPAAYKKRDDFIELSEAVFNTYVEGTRKNNFGARVESFPITGTKKELKISFPENYGGTVDQQYDFQVFKIYKYTNYRDTNWADLTIYIGDHPSYFYKEYGLDEASSKKIPGKFLDKKVEWLSFYNAEQGMYLKEQQIPCDEIGKGRLVHIAILSNKDSFIDELTKLVETIQLK